MPHLVDETAQVIPSTPSSQSSPQSAPPRAQSIAASVRSNTNSVNYSRPSTNSTPSHSPYPSPRVPAGSSDYFSKRSQDNESRVLSWSPAPPSLFAASPRNISRGSMILYQIGTPDLAHSHSEEQLLPPRTPFGNSSLNRLSYMSTSGDSVISFASDSKYPTGEHGPLVAYVYDPALDEPEEDDFMHDPKVQFVARHRFPWRGIVNMSTLVVLLLGLSALFLIYPVFDYMTNTTSERHELMVNNPRINSTGQAMEEWIPIGGGRSLTTSRTSVTSVVVSISSTTATTTTTPLDTATSSPSLTLDTTFTTTDLSVTEVSSAAAIPTNSPI